MSATELENKTRQQSVRELWCEGCGYGVIIRRDPPQCPMCRQMSWRERPPLARYN
jgi:rubrerythrin